MSFVWPLAFPMEPTEAIREAAQASSRRSDPVTSQKAAQAVTPGLSAMDARIVNVMSEQYWVPMTAFRIAQLILVIEPGRWAESSIRTRVSALGKAGRLVKATETQTSPRGREADAWLLPR